MNVRSIRALALCVFGNRGRILVNVAHDSVKGRDFCRPLGGGIEFGETGEQAVAREIREELGAAVRGLRLLGVLENIFTYEGVPGHEIVFVYDGLFADSSFYGLEAIPGIESDGAQFSAKWKTLDAFSDELPLYPDGLVQLLQT